MCDLDQAVISAYIGFDVPSDQIVKDDALKAAFVKHVASHMSSDEAKSEPSTVIDRLIYLRKRGQLPRIRR